MSGPPDPSELGPRLARALLASLPALELAADLQTADVPRRDALRRLECARKLVTLARGEGWLPAEGA